MSTKRIIYQSVINGLVHIKDGKLLPLSYDDYLYNVKLQNKLFQKLLQEEKKEEKVVTKFLKKFKCPHGHNAPSDCMVYGDCDTCECCCECSNLADFKEGN